MLVFENSDPAQMYYEQLFDLVNNGNTVEVRGRKTRELLNVVTEFDAPWRHCILIPARRWNPWLAMSEALWLLSGREGIASLLPYNSRIKDFSDDGKILYGAYGRRIYSQIDDVILRLLGDQNDRRAVIQIWDKRDLLAVTKDPPCNTQLMFKIRGGKLHMTVVNRSNDLHWGLYAVNYPEFGILLCYLAERLGVGIGTQTHFSQSLHIYEDEPRAVAIKNRMSPSRFTYRKSLPRYPQVNERRLGFEAFMLHQRVAELCSGVLDGLEPVSGPAFLQFAFDFLAMYKDREIKPATMMELYPDWMLAANIWAQEVWQRGEGREVPEAAGIEASLDY